MKKNALVVLILSLAVLGLVFLYLGLKDTHTTTKEQGIQSQDIEEVPSYAYITQLTDRSVVLDSVEVVKDEEAIEKALDDGVCSKRETCFQSAPPVYDRNLDQTEKTFTLAEGYSITDMRGSTVSVTDILKNPGWLIVSQIDAHGHRFGTLFKVTYNSNNEVMRLDGEFRQ